MPVVSQRVTPCTPSPAKRWVQRSTSSTSTSPSMGQPIDVDSDTLIATVVAFTTPITSRNCANDCSRLMRRFARLWVSLTDITRLTSSTPHDNARSAPRTFGTSTV